MMKIRDAISTLGHNNDPAIDWSGTGNFRFAYPKMITRDSESMMFGVQVDTKSTGHFSADARIIVRDVIGNSFTEDGFFRACNMNLDWQGTIPLASFQPDSCFVQLKYQHFDDVVTCADLYCGGFGGWQHAASYLSSHFDLPIKYLWAIDRDSTAAYCHCQNFGGKLISEEVVEHFPLPLDEKVVICGSCDFVLLNRVNFQRPTKGASASFPCPPWSRGSKGKGFDYQDGGLAILEVLRAGIVNNWEYIMLENVDAIVEHFHFSWICTYIDTAGYYIAYSNISCIGDISAAKRKRWVCIILQKHLQCRVPPRAFDWTAIMMPTLRNFKIIPACLPEQHEKDLTLSNELLSIYGNPVFAPPSLKSRFTIEKRIKKGCDQMSTATATYSRQHELPDDVIRTDLHSYGKGIYADLVNGKHGPRFWSPIEIAMTMIIFQRTYFPLQSSEAHKMVGNAISTLHALKTMYALFAGCFKRKVPCFEDVYHHALRNRLHMENTNIHISNDWIVVEPFRPCIRDIEISMTLPMCQQMTIHIDDQTKMIEIPLNSTIDDLLVDLGILWDDVFVSWKPAHIRAKQKNQIIPDQLDELRITKRYCVCTDLLPINVAFAEECIRQIKALEATAISSTEPVFFPIQICIDETKCMTLNVWTGSKVKSIAKICWDAGNKSGIAISCIRFSPTVAEAETIVGWWGISQIGQCEIHVFSRKENERHGSTLIFFDENRKSPLLGQRIGEASHPGPAKSLTIEFKFGNRTHVVARQDLNSRLTKHDIAAVLGVKTYETILWNPILQESFSWDQLDTCDTSCCYVRSLQTRDHQKKKQNAISFWDFLPTSMPRIEQCEIDRKIDFTFGIIHKLSKKEIFNKQFEKIVHQMNEKFSKLTGYNHEVSITPCSQNASDDLIAKPQMSSTSTERVHEMSDQANDETYHDSKNKTQEPKHAAGKNRRCRKSTFASQYSTFWIHLPLGRHCVVTEVGVCKDLGDLVQKAFLQSNVSNGEYIMKGCYCSVNCKICSYQTKIESIPGTVIRVYFRGLLGGGKEDIMRKSSARLGELLIHKGLPLNAVATKAQKIIEKLGLSQVHQALQNQNEIHAWRQIEQLAQKIDFVIFNEKEKKSLSATLIQRAIKKKKKGNLTGSSIAVDQFTLPVGIFINEDQSDTPIISIDKLRAGSHGIVLTTEEKITPWIQNNVKSSVDELGAIFLGNPTMNISDSYDPTAICFAAINHEGKECVLRGTLLQLGGKKVALNRHFKVEGANASMTTCSLTAYASDFDSDNFAALISSPAKRMLAQLPSDTIRNAISSVWGRSFMRDGKRVPNLEAESVQVHISIKSEKVPELLKCSGICNIYITPKIENGLFDPKYHLIWTDLSKIAIEQKTNEITNHLGFIKGRKGYALRFLATDAQDGFNSLFPGKTFEKPIAVNALYRLQPVPFGILPEVLTEACKAIKWNIKPIKRSGNSWLVGAEKQSPNKFLIIDGNTILVKEVEKTNNGKSSVFLAGPRPKTNPKDNGTDPFQSNDPWANFKPSNSANMPSTNQPGGPTTTRSVTGPVEDRFKSQESRIQKLEQKLDDTMVQMKTHQEETKFEIAKQQKEIVDMKDAFKSELVGLQKGITMSFQDSLKQAIQQQTQDMRKMFLETPTGSSPLKKQPKTS